MESGCRRIEKVTKPLLFMVIRNSSFLLPEEEGSVRTRKNGLELTIDTAWVGWLRFSHRHGR